MLDRGFYRKYCREHIAQENAVQEHVVQENCTGGIVQRNIVQKILYTKVLCWKYCTKMWYRKYCTGNLHREVLYRKGCTETAVQEILYRKMLYNKCCTENCGTFVQEISLCTDSRFSVRKTPPREFILHNYERARWRARKMSLCSDNRFPVRKPPPRAFLIRAHARTIMNVRCGGARAPRARAARANSECAPPFYPIRPYRPPGAGGQLYIISHILYFTYY